MAEFGSATSFPALVTGLFPELSSGGGVQRASRHIAAVLARFAEQGRIPYRFLSLNDPRGGRRLQVGGRGFEVRGYGRSKVQFCAAVLALARQRRQLVVATHPHLAPAAWMIQVLSRPAYSIVFSHGIDVWETLPWFRRWTLRRSDLLLAPSRDTARRLTEVQGVPERRVQRLPWGLDPGFDSSTAKGGRLAFRLPSGRIVLTVARLAAKEVYKGVDTLIQALPTVLPEVSDLQLVVVGDGDDGPRLRRLAAELGVAERVHFLGSVGPEELLACYQGCDLFALPSRAEGFGLVFLEAMGVGKAVVGGAHGGTPDIVEDGVTGCLVHDGDVGELAGVLGNLLKHAELRSELGRRAQERVRSHYLYEHFQADLTRILEEKCASLR
ncbi:MAG: glycosyltransferase family 4 protein [Gemmatimonadetes bacterium]|nr:glycosyltransferase family 4 protein [Gemmatimonadota bacterium]